MTLRIVALTLFGMTALIVVPIVALVIFALTYKPAYVLDTTALGGIETSAAPEAFPAGYVSLEPVRGGLAIGPGRTARYPDGSIVTIVRTDEAAATIDSYGDSLQGQWSNQNAIAGEVSRDLGLPDGRVVRLLGEGEYLFAFFAPNEHRLVQLVTACAGVHRNRERGWGNAVAGHPLLAVGVAFLWVFVSFVLIGIGIWRLVVSSRVATPESRVPPGAEDVTATPAG
jgi:hypothetical protein